MRSCTDLGSASPVNHPDNPYASRASGSGLPTSRLLRSDLPGQLSGRHHAQVPCRRPFSCRTIVVVFSENLAGWVSEATGQMSMCNTRHQTKSNGCCQNSATYCSVLKQAQYAIKSSLASAVISMTVCGVEKYFSTLRAIASTSGTGMLRLATANSALRCTRACAPSSVAWDARNLWRPRQLTHIPAHTVSPATIVLKRSSVEQPSARTIRKHGQPSFDSVGSKTRLADSSARASRVRPSDSSMLGNKGTHDTLSKSSGSKMEDASAACGEIGLPNKNKIRSIAATSWFPLCPFLACQR